MGWALGGSVDHPMAFVEALLVVVIASPGLASAAGSPGSRVILFLPMITPRPA